MEVDLSMQEELHADQKAIHQMEFVGQLKKLDSNGNVKDARDDQSMYILKILEKTKGTRLKFSQGILMVL